MTPDEIIAVVQAFKEGKKIECRYVGMDNKWEETLDPRWNFNDFDYRVKPEPRGWWAVIQSGSNYIADCFTSKDRAEGYRAGLNAPEGFKTIRLQEVPEDES